MIQDMSNNQVLIIDDEPMQREIVRKQLEERGFIVQVAASGREGLEIWRNNPRIRLIITDLMMPEMDGYEVIETIRLQENNYTYLIVLSVSNSHNSLMQALKLGADDYLTKPVSAAELDLRLKKASRLIRLGGMDDLVFSLAELSGFRNDESGPHLRMVQAHCKIMADHLMNEYPELVLTKTSVKDIATASLLHDIGKVAVPDAILLKPGPLTSAEFEQVKTHTTIGGQLLRKIYNKNGSNFFKIAYKMATSHHERWDGSGYPQGLSGNDIPLPSRIMAVVDSYDAMTEQRCYKEPLSPAQAAEIVTNEAGRQFDPMVVDAFLKTTGKRSLIRRECQAPLLAWRDSPSP